MCDMYSIFLHLYRCACVHVLCVCACGHVWVCLCTECVVFVYVIPNIFVCTSGLHVHMHVLKHKSKKMGNAVTVERHFCEVCLEACPSMFVHACVSVLCTGRLAAPTSLRMRPIRLDRQFISKH